MMRIPSALDFLSWSITSQNFLQFPKYPEALFKTIHKNKVGTVCKIRRIGGKTDIEITFRIEVIADFLVIGIPVICYC